MIRIITGPGTAPKNIDFQEGDTIETVLQRAGIILEQGEVAVVRGAAITDAAKTPAEDKTTIVIDSMPQNGAEV